MPKTIARGARRSDELERSHSDDTEDICVPSSGRLDITFAPLP